MNARLSEEAFGAFNEDRFEQDFEAIFASGPDDEPEPLSEKELRALERDDTE